MLFNLKNLKEKYNLNITGVAHVGAHVGGEHNTYKEVGINPKDIYYFEPFTENYRKLLINTGNESHYYNVALGSEHKTAYLNVERVNGSQSCSILEPKHHLTMYPGIIFNDKELVYVETLDSILDPEVSKEFAKVNFLNMDVQGYELEVLKGALKTLPQIDYILTEINVDEMYDGCVKFKELFEFLTQQGFYIAETDLQHVSWGDAFLIRG